MIVQGAVVDERGVRAAYVRFDGDRVAEVGQIGTDSTRGRVKRLRGIVVPPPANGHTHLGDAVATREPPAGPLADLVAPPNGWKFQLLRGASDAQKRVAIGAALDRMAREGVAATIDFREEGRPGVALLRAAARGRPVRVVALGRPLGRPVEHRELADLLRAADGIALSSVEAEAVDGRRTIQRACRSAGKLYALHASENERESPDDYLDPAPDLLVHVTRATPGDLEAVRAAGATVAVCPRSNALFGRQPPLPELERLGIRTVLGTDNAMFHAPSMWRELEFAYVAARLSGRRVSPEFLARSAFVSPWQLLGSPEMARIEAGGPARPLVLRLPTDDPAYQLVCRATEHLIVRPRRSGARRRGR